MEIFFDIFIWFWFFVFVEFVLVFGFVNFFYISFILLNSNGVESLHHACETAYYFQLTLI